MATSDGFYEYRTQEIKGYFIVTFKYNFRLYDVILVDEAQDFSKYFLQMCYMSLPHESRMLVYAYDELQSLDNKTLNLRKTFLDTVMDGRM